MLAGRNGIGIAQIVSADRRGTDVGIMGLKLPPWLR